MTIATLIERGSNPAFAFDHYMAHSQYYGAMFPLDRFSVLPYLLDPESDIGTPAGDWNVNHQQAHQDFLLTLPSYFGSLLPGLPISQVMVETNLSDPEQMQWWTFVNLIEHQMGGAVLPLSGWVYPFA